MGYKNFLNCKKHLIHLKKKFNGPSIKFLIIPHKNPDGDAMGASLALSIYLQKLGHQVNIISPTGFPDFLYWLPNINQVIVFAQERMNKIEEKIYQADIIFLIDFNTLSRVKPLDVFLQSSPAFKILIDHHLTPDTFDLMLSDPSAPATAVLIFRLIEQMGHLDYIDQDIASCLYTAIINDTGSFRFPSVTSEAHIIAAHLIEKGVNIAEMQDRLYAVYTPERIKLLIKALKGMKILSKYNTAYMCVNSGDIQDHNLQKGDTEGFVNYGLNLKNISFSVLFIEDCIKKIIKISFRSKGDFNVNSFASKHFQGGGHLNAAGGISKESLKSTLERFLNILLLYRGQLF